MRTRIMRFLGLGQAQESESASEAANELLVTSTGEKAISADQLVVMAIGTRADEIDCQEFFEQMDRFVELGLAKEDAASLMPLMQDHVERCGDCREEYEALQRALQAVA